MIVLASQSSSRRALLAAAQIEFEAVSPSVDEEAAKEAFREDGLNARSLADALAELKSLKVSKRIPGALTLGCDQTLALEDGMMIDKAKDRVDAERILGLLSGKVHYLHSAAVVSLNGEPIWRSVERAKMFVRDLSERFIQTYLDNDWEECRWCVGCYRIEGPGVQLFNKVEGSQFVIQGLPLLPLMDFLRTRGVMPV